MTPFHPSPQTHGMPETLTGKAIDPLTATTAKLRAWLRDNGAQHIVDETKKYLFPPNLVLLFPLHNMTYCVNIVKILRISR
jgi:hypothetical protein